MVVSSSFLHMSRIFGSLKLPPVRGRVGNLQHLSHVPPHQVLEVVLVVQRNRYVHRAECSLDRV